MRQRVTSRSAVGAAAVEFALILPVMLLIIGGIVDFGRFFFLKVELTNAAREGARAAIVGSDMADVQARTQAATIPVPSGFSATVTPCAGAGTDAKVLAQANFEWFVLTPVMGMFGGAGSLPATVDSTAVMRCTA